ncbi:MAG: EAL domain-containing protein [Alkaliphilus sp.]
MFKNRLFVILTTFIIFGLLMSIMLLPITEPQANNMKNIIIAGDENFPPFEFVDAEGDYRGFNVDIMQAIGLEMGLDISLKPMPWTEAVDALKKGDVDAIQGMARSEEREEYFSFVDHSIKNAAVIFVRKDIVYINSVDDLEGVRVAFQKGDIGTKILQDYPEIIPVYFTDQEEAIKALVAEEVEAFIGNRMVSLYFAQKYNLLDEIKIIGEPFQAYEYGAVTLKGNIEVFDLFNEGMIKIKKSGLHSKIHKTWFGETFVNVEALRRRYTTIALISIISLIVVVGIAVLVNRRLRQLVNRRTNKLVEANKKLEDQQIETHKIAYYNNVTGLPNREMLLKELHRKINFYGDEELNFALLFLNIDKFKNINNTMGREVGDKLLMEVAQRIKAVIDDSTFIANFAGDNFAIICEKTKKESDCASIADMLMRSISETFVIDNYEVHITTSIGMTIFPLNSKNPHELLKHSEIAKFHAKNLGGNRCCVYDDSMEKEEWKNLAIIEGLRTALDNDEFRLYYQPKVDLNTGKIIGMEALLRWYHPELGKISPDEFISIAEETGLIVPIGEWVIKTACLKTKEWHDDGYKSLHIAVNISPRQFQGYNIEKSVEKILEETNLEPRYLVLEITESIVVESVNDANDTLDALKKLGVSISIDDFGSGYSNFSRLNEMSIDEIKIDKSIVQAAAKSSDSMVIVDVILMMAKKLNMTVTAEGVETIEQREYLKEKQCDSMQGYLFSPPLPAETFGDMLRNKKS